MKKIITILTTILVLLTSCNQEKGPEKIFNGTDLEGWTVKCVGEDHGKAYWFVADSSIIANSIGDTTHDYIWLQYNKELRDFVLEFEFQPVRGSSGNSGVQIRSRYDEKEQWLNGPQVDIHPPGYWRTGMMWDETRGNQRWIFPDLPKGEWVDPSMVMNEPSFYFRGDSVDWNRMKIKVEGLQVESWLNGLKVTEFNGEGILNDSTHLAKKVGVKGYIALQIHTGDELQIRFKNITLNELD